MGYLHPIYWMLTPTKITVSSTLEKRRCAEGTLLSQHSGGEMASPQLTSTVITLASTGKVFRLGQKAGRSICTIQMPWSM